MYVYFIKTGAKPPMVKIGRSDDPTGRMSELQTGCPYDLILLGSIKCKSLAHSVEIERSAHEVFANYRKRGEWFKYSRFVAAVLRAAIDKQATDLRLLFATAGSKYGELRKAEKAAGYARIENWVEEKIESYRDEETREHMRSILG